VLGSFGKRQPDPEKHFLIQQFDPWLTLTTFREGLGSDDILIYVHGYANSFKDCILRAAQLQHDLEFFGKVIAFSWPSAGATLLTVTDPFDGRERRVEVAYKHDEAAAAGSHPFFAEVLSQLLKEKQPSQRIHVLAHSMGNRERRRTSRKEYARWLFRRV
jgi:esterase/lipase superfamily enzyme